MKKLQTLINQYEAQYKKDLALPELEVFPTEGNPGLSMWLIGTFPENNLDQSTITYFSIIGLWFDLVKIDETEENFFFDLMRAVFEGEFEYIIHKRNLIEKLLGGIAYLNIGTPDASLISNFKCVDQSRVKRLIRNGKLNTITYIKK